MNRVLIFFVLSAIMIFLSCDDQLLFIQCSDCTESEPVYTDLVAKLDNDIGNGFISNVNIYEGNIEDSILLGTYAVVNSIWMFSVPVNKKYTLSVTYEIDGVTYIAIDSATPRVRYERDRCEKPCYIVYDNTVNLRIKYTK
jgi:hypothetical protein